MSNTKQTVETDEPRHPEVVVELVGQDGNAFGIASRTRMALKRAGVSNEECASFFDEAMSGDFDHVLETVRAWVTVH